MHDQVDVLGVGGIVDNHVGPRVRGAVRVGVRHLEAPPHGPRAFDDERVAARRGGGAVRHVDDGALTGILPEQDRLSRRTCHGLHEGATISASMQPHRIAGLDAATRSAEREGEAPRSIDGSSRARTAGRCDMPPRRWAGGRGRRRGRRDRRWPIDHARE